MLDEFKFGPYLSSILPRLPLPRICICPCSQKPVIFRSWIITFKQVVTEFNGTFLGAFEKLHYVCLFVHVEQLVFHWTDFN